MLLIARAAEIGSSQRDDSPTACEADAAPRGEILLQRSRPQEGMMTSPRTIVHLQQTMKRIIKSLLFRDEYKPRRIRYGIGRGVVLLLNRRHQLQKELGLYEAETHGAYKRFIRPGHVVYDVGAADGDTAFTLARLASPGRVIAFEPDVPLQDAFKQNEVFNPNLRVQMIARYIGTDDEEKRTVSLDSLVRSGTIPPPNLVKIDVDGGEEQVLSGMLEILNTVRPVILVETHSADLEHRCAASLASCGYTVQIIKNAFWRVLLPEGRPIDHNRWLLATPPS